MSYVKLSFYLIKFLKRVEDVFFVTGFCTAFQLQLRRTLVHLYHYSTKGKWYVLISNPSISKRLFSLLSTHPLLLTFNVIDLILPEARGNRIPAPATDRNGRLFETARETWPRRFLWSYPGRT